MHRDLECNYFFCSFYQNFYMMNNNFISVVEFQSCIVGNTVIQSICTHYSCFENQGRFVTLKKESFWKKQDAKKQGHRYSKGEEAAWSLLFLINNNLVFLYPAFLKVPNPKKISGQPEKLE